MNRDELLKLAEWVEGGLAKSIEGTSELFYVLDCIPWPASAHFIPAVNGSLDAALALLNEVLPKKNRERVNIEYIERLGWRAFVSEDLYVSAATGFKNGYSGKAQTPAAAIVAAILRALAEKGEE